MDQPITLSEIIEKTIKINNCFLERFLKKKGFYNFKRKHSGSRKKYGDLIELDTAYKKP
jgi:hypothetical protein